MKILTLDYCTLPLQPTENIAVVVIYSFFAISGTVGNVLIVLAIHRTTSLRNVCGLFIANQAVADVLVTAVVNPLVVFVFVQGFLQLCLLNIPLLIANLTARLSCAASLLTITALSVDRCFAICSPMKHKVMATFGKAKMILAIIWILSLLLLFLEAFLEGNPALGYLQTFGVVLCWVVIIASGIAIVINVRVMTLRVNILQENQQQRQVAVNMRERNKQVARTIVVVVIVFFLCWMPVAVVMSVPRTIHEISLFLWCASLGLANSALNPWIYFYRQRNYRRALQAILNCRRSAVDVGGRRA